MQCFQKDPNLRVTARKLLRHAWIFGCRRNEPQVSRAPSNFSQAVEEVKQWNKALKSSETTTRTSTGLEPSGLFQSGQNGPRFRESDAHRSNHSTPAKGPLNLAKSRGMPEALGSPEVPGKASPLFHLIHGGCANLLLQMTITGTMTLRRPSHPAPSTFPIFGPRITLAACSPLTV